MVDYRLLLAKYMQHVLSEEGSTFISQIIKQPDGHRGTFSDVHFNNEEWAVLVALDNFEPDATTVQIPPFEKWHAPGLGEVHNDDHTVMIYCEKQDPDDDEHSIVDDDTAKHVAALLSMYGTGFP